MTNWIKFFVLKEWPWLLTFLVLVSLMFLSGCSSIPADLQAHEERHCEGWTHTSEAPFYQWTQTRPPSPRPWLYVHVDDIDRTCRNIGLLAANGHHINACAQWKPAGCVIYLPK